MAPRGPLLGAAGAVLDAAGALLGAAGAVLDAAGAVLGTAGAVLGAAGAVLGAAGALLGAGRVPLSPGALLSAGRTLLCSSGALLGSSGALLGSLLSMLAAGTSKSSSKSPLPASCASQTTAISASSTQRKTHKHAETRNVHKMNIAEHLPYFLLHFRTMFAILPFCNFCNLQCNFCISSGCTYLTFCKFLP